MDDNRGTHDRAAAWRRLLAAPDKFRGSLTAREAAAAMAAAARAGGWTATELPLADGGEGTLEALGGPNRRTAVSGPLGLPVEAGWRLDRGLAVIEMAQASGLALAGGPQGNDPLGASTRGTGELIAVALAAGAERIVVGVGGSATTDGGAGAVEVLRPWAPFAVPVEVACDVDTSFLAAAEVFGPQKGATPAQVRELGRRLQRLALSYRSEFGLELRGLPRGGAAGGLAGGLAALGARLVPGFQLVAEAVGLAAAVSDADLVVTGEGRLDATSFAGKVVGEVAALARSAAIPVLIVAGEVDRRQLREPAVSLVERFGAEASWRSTAACLERVVAERIDSPTARS